MVGAVLTCGSDPSRDATVFVLSCAALPETGAQDGAGQGLRGELDGDSSTAGTGCADVFDMLSRKRREVMNVSADEYPVPRSQSLLVVRGVPRSSCA